MARSASPDGADKQSLGDLVALAAKDVSELIHYEISLAKKEFKVDLRRAAFSSSFVAFVLLVAYPLLLMLLFAYAYGLYAAGAPGGLWGAFLWVALTVGVFAAVAAAIGFVFFKKITGMRLTRKTVADDIDMLKQRGGSSAADAGTGTGAVGAGKTEAVADKDAPASIAAR
jgi:hypothetical protein